MLYMHILHILQCIYSNIFISYIFFYMFIWEKASDILFRYLNKGINIDYSLI